MNDLVMLLSVLVVFGSLSYVTYDVLTHDNKKVK